MIPWELLGRAKVSVSGEELTLHRRGGEYSIKVDGSLLMDSSAHSSEDALAEIVIPRLHSLPRPRVLVGGLGMGFTLAAALKGLGPAARVDVSELVPEVVEWNGGPLGALAGYPLKDRRVSVLLRDIALVLREARETYDAVLQDVDNGPQGQTMKANDRLYSEEGLSEARAALRPNGILAFWSARPNKPFVKRLRRADFEVSEVPVRSRGHRGAHYVVWVAVRKDRP
ncbi:MAG: spermidine synthase [Elusimicrobiota bacterium]|jgi:spermidine synthase